MLKIKHKEEEDPNGIDPECTTVSMFQDFLKRWEEHEDNFIDLKKTMNEVNRNTKHLEVLPMLHQEIVSLRSSNENTQRELIQAIVSKNKSTSLAQLVALLFFGIMALVLLLDFSNKDLDLSQHSLNIREHEPTKQ